jgi:HEAT repeat protein
MRDRRQVNLLERIGWRYVALLFVFLLLLPRNEMAEPLESFAHALTRHHIELTEPTLIEALRNPDNEVRGLAAWELLEMKAEDSLPQILQAMRDERGGATKVDLASAAAYLGGEKDGTAALEGVCHDSSEPGWVRTDAARHLFDLHDRACLPDLWRLMESGNESDTRIAAINLVSQLQDRTASESAQIEHFTLEALDDPDIRLRWYAAVTLADLRDATAIPYLRMAIQVEKQDITKSQMEASLRSLLALKPAA